ncbi:uncharacterized protein N7511_008249 [Penicillium nucicola]|uniref:uncharacterized protein n=1 Tax=Penicillium nucicola TaxID=1850975 RepID=UPI0025458EC1|nr:uncharacterized protein N7511_008249 [Penicillium nucicola]KAJ5754096.1 hypothetical protein N7511_008249 [Penicillium nucicola]
MEWPYQFLHLDEAGRQERRAILDRYGLYGQLSAFIPITLVLIFRLTRKILNKTLGKNPSYDAVPTSPSTKPPKRTIAFSLTQKLRRWLWWLENDIEIAGQRWSRVDQLIFGGMWTAWLMFLCLNQTRNDYFLLTRKFGALGASQLPIQYLLSLKRLNPVAIAFRTSHENINRWHRVLGWISYFFIFLHGSFYINYYIQVGGLGAAFFRTVPVLGMLGLLGMTCLSATTIKVVRQYSYRVFFITHLAVALVLPISIWFHVPHGRLFMAQAFLVLIADMVARKFYTVACPATVDMVPGTDLIKVMTEVPPARLRRFAAHPGSHAYLSVPQATFLPSGVLSNPFTVVSANEETGYLTFVARRMHGLATQTLARFAGVHWPNTKLTLNLDGPYGAATYFPDLAAGFDKVLLVAGGVGATFITPLYEHIITENPAARVQLVWAVRNTDELVWSRVAKDDNRIRVFVTGEQADSDSAGSSTGLPGEFGDVELDILEKDRQQNATVPPEIRRRPDLQEIVDEFLGYGVHEHCAVVVCGPELMTSDLRNAIGIWI